MKFYLFKVTPTTTTTTTARPTTTTTTSTNRPTTTFSGFLSKLNLFSNYFERILSEISPWIIMGPFFEKLINKKDLTFEVIRVLKNNF